MKLSELLKRLFGQRDDARVEDSESGFAPDEWADVDPFDPFPEPVRLEIRDEFDLHSIQPRDVRRVVEEYLQEARRAGFHVVRIIHGKGVGVQREIVRSVLARTPFVEHFADAHKSAGGWGATIARLSPPAREKGKDAE
jgi:dsDNA-specific endonuclease/ATPase MutS2